MAEVVLLTAQRLTASMEALAALGAWLRLRREGLQADPSVTALLNRVVNEIAPGVEQTLTPQQETVALGFIRSFFGQAIELLDNPARVPGWVHEDPSILEQQGLASRVVVKTMAALAEASPRFRALVSRPSCMLDIGTGVGRLAIEAAETWPNMVVEGIDVFEPALNRARANLATSSVADRVTLRQQSVADIDSASRYDVVWFPGPFIPLPLVEPSLSRIRRALKPGGALVFGFFGAPTPLAEALTDLRVVRAGGHPWTAAGIVDLLGRHDFEALEVFAPQSLATLVVGHRSP